jgi:hypothetical protein
MLAMVRRPLAAVTFARTIVVMTAVVPVTMAVPVHSVPDGAAKAEQHTQ